MYFIDMASAGLRPLKTFALMAALVACFASGVTPAAHASVFINEIRYDPPGTDTGEAIEIAGTEGTSLDGWRVVLYNGSNGLAYATDLLSGSLIDAGNGFGFMTINHAGIQNGSPDGIALVDAANSVVQFLSYEGAFAALDGVAAGLTSFDIGVAENGSGSLVGSLQLTGTGTDYSDFTWAAFDVSTFGVANTRQTFGGGSDSGQVPEPASLALFGLGLASLAVARRRLKSR